MDPVPFDDSPSNHATCLTPSKSESRISDECLPSPPRTPMLKQHSNFPSLLRRYASTTDQYLVRLRRLLSTSTGLETFLSTINYLFYLLAYLETWSPSAPAFWQRLLKFTNIQPRVSQFSPSGTNHLPHPRPTAPLGSLGKVISEARITLRLTALLPLYTWLRELLVNNERQDRYLTAISLTQCISYITYQFTENVAFLADRGIISQKWLGKRGGSLKWWLWSSRAWLVGVSCDFLRLFRKALIQKQSEARARQAGHGRTQTELEEQRLINRIWWSEMIVASCWFPICLHHSLQGGLKGVNTGIVGLLGFLANAQSFATQWANTEIQERRAT